MEIVFIVAPRILDKDMAVLVVVKETLIVEKYKLRIGKI